MRLPKTTSQAPSAARLDRRLFGTLLAGSALAALVAGTALPAVAQEKPLLRVSAQNKDTLETFRVSGVADDAPYRIEWILLPTATEESAALLANTVDLNIQQGAVSVTLQQANAKESWAGGKAPVTIISAQSPPDPDKNKTMVTIVDADGPIKEGKDLKGRSITFKEGGNMNTQALLSIKQAGLKAGDVRLVNLSQPDGLVAFRTGKVDALANNPGRLQPLLKTGKARILYTNTDVGFPASTATVVRTGDLADPAKVAIFRDFVLRIQKWNDWKAANPEKFEQVLIESTHLKPDDAKYAVQNGVSDVVALDDAFLKTEQRIADVLAEMGGIPKQVDISLQYDTRFNDDVVKQRKLSN
jgi:sulfonate transport system substrate-binding protein